MTYCCNACQASITEFLKVMKAKHAREKTAAAIGNMLKRHGVAMEKQRAKKVNFNLFQ